MGKLRDKLKKVKNPKFTLATSCFLPLFIVYFVECVLFLHFHEQIDVSIGDMHWIVNLVNVIVLCILILTGFWGLIKFTIFSKNKKNYLESQAVSIIILEVENITATYFFTYFSLFIIAFFAINITSVFDMVVFYILLVLMSIVYCRKEMYFVNPMLNILGYGAFKIKYTHGGKMLIANMLSKKNLNNMIDEDIYVFISDNDFTIELQKEQTNDK